jgi:hypothetical protein
MLLNISQKKISNKKEQDMPRFKITKHPISGGDVEIEIIRFPNSILKNVTRLMKDLYHDYEVGVEELPNVYDKQVVMAKLSTGRALDLMNFSFHLTYGDMIEGDPDKYWNEELLNHLEKKFEKDDKPTLFRRPSQEIIEDELPVFYGIAEWKCYQGLSPEETSSELRVIWFIDSMENLSFREMIEMSLKDLDWEMHAQGYDPGDF